MQKRVEQIPSEIDRLRTQIVQMLDDKKSAEKMRDAEGKVRSFDFVTPMRTITKHEDINAYLHQQIAKRFERPFDEMPKFRIGDFTVSVELRPGEMGQAMLAVKGQRDPSYSIPLGSAANADNWQRIVNFLDGSIEKAIEDSNAKITKLETDLKQAQELVGVPFDREEELLKAKIDFAELEARLSGLSEQQDAIIDPDETDEEETAEERAEREAYTGNESHVIIPPQITKICANCINNNQDIISITLPDGLLEIGAVAFSGCTNLESINIPDTVTTIGSAAFGNCSSLTSVTIPASVTELGMLLFTGCSSLKQVEMECEIYSVPYLCFSECAVEEITLPDSVQVIANQAFAGCSALKTVHTGTQLQRIEEKAFLNCAKLEDISLPAQMQYIDTTAFDGCDLLKEKHMVNDSFIIDQILIQAKPQYPIYQIPENVVTVMNDALHQTDVVAIECSDSLRYIRESAFSSNSYLMDIKFNQGCQTIAENALSDCRSLNSVYIPDSVNSIEHQDNLYLTALYGIPGSAAEEFAANNQISFHENKPVQNYANVKFDYTKDGWHFGNTKNVFGENYILTEQDRAYLSDLGIDAENIDKEWQGACAGLSSTVILMKNGIISPQQFQEDSISEIELTKAVQSFINFYQLSFIKRNSGQWKSTNQKIYLLNDFLPTKQREGELFLLTFSLSSGSHAVVGYELESGKWEYDGKSYDRRILVWDPNYPNV